MAVVIDPPPSCSGAAYSGVKTPRVAVASRASSSTSLAMPKSSSFTWPSQADENVRRLDIAMYDQQPMRGLDRVTHVDDQAQTRANVELRRIGVVGDRCAVDVFHHQIRNASFGNAGVDKTRDVRVIERCQQLPFAQEQTLLELGVQTTPQQLHGDALRHVASFTFGEEHGGHAATADFCDKTKSADLRSDQSRSD